MKGFFLPGSHKRTSLSEIFYLVLENGGDNIMGKETESCREPLHHSDQGVRKRMSHFNSHRGTLVEN